MPGKGYRRTIQIITQFSPPITTAAGTYWTVPLIREAQGHGCVRSCPLWERCIEAVRRGDPVGCEWPLKRELPGHSASHGGDDLEKRIIEIARKSGLVTIAELRRTLQVSSERLISALRDMERRGVLVEVRDARGRRLGRALAES